MKPYQQIQVKDNLEPLIPIPLEIFARETPHPYVKLGAPYGERSPYYLRSGVLKALTRAQQELQETHLGLLLKIFDAFRPVEVQQFMVDYTFKQLSDWSLVYEFWAIPSYDPTTPPPHSTGGAVDLTLVDELGNTLDLGGEIDEISKRSQPDYYANSDQEKEKQYHNLRNLLNQVMKKAGFYRHPGEWWHFSLGDQMWAWQHNQENPKDLQCARYGRIS